jgi:hypothetical protein
MLTPGEIIIVTMITVAAARTKYGLTLFRFDKDML